MSDSSVTQEEVESLFDKDGDMREEPQQDEEPQEEEEQQASEEQSEPEEEESTEIDWTAIDERYAKAYESTKSEAEKWKSDYAKIQAHLTKQGQTRKEMESTLAKYEAQVNQLRQWEALLEQHSGLESHIQQFLAKAQNPLQADIPDYLKDDPAFKYVNERINPYVQSLEQKLKALEQKTGKIDEYEKQTQEAQYKQHLDSQLESAGQRIKSMFGRDATEEEITQVLEYMVENKYYNNGAAAAVAVFQDQYEKTIQERFNREMSEKAKKFPPRNKSVNGARSTTSKEATSVEEAIKMAMQEQGYN